MTSFVPQYGPWAVVTGAAAGVGLAFTEELVERGLGVVMVDRSDQLDAVAASVEGPTRTVSVDLADQRWLDALATATSDLEVGLAVANAGISVIGPYLELDAAGRRAMLAVNCAATADLASWALPAMVERGRGGFVATSSGSALAGTTGVALYSATKAFAVNLVEAIGWELRDTGVDTLAIVAPSMATPGFAASAPDVDRMLSPAVEPRGIVAAALDALPEGGRWLADPGLEFAAAVERRDRVDLLGAATTGMYPQVFDR